MATETTDDSIYLSHYGQEIDDCIDDVNDAMGAFESLAAKIANLTERIEALERAQPVPPSPTPSEIDGLDYEWEKGEIDSSGEDSGTSRFWLRCVDHIPIPSGIASVKVDATYSQEDLVSCIFCYDSSKNFLGKNSTVVDKTTEQQLETGTAYIRLVVHKVSGQAMDMVEYLDKCDITLIEEEEEE